MTSVLRSGARRLLAQAVEMEVTAFIAAHGDLEDDAGRRRVVRHGHHRERQVQTGIGPVAVRCPRVRDRGGSGEAGKIRFTSAILPPYLRRAKSIEELLPWLYLKGISTGDFTEALAALLGPDAPGLSASTITRLKDVWQGELARWEKRDLSARRYLYSIFNRFTYGQKRVRPTLFHVVSVGTELHLHSAGNVFILSD